MIKLVDFIGYIEVLTKVMDFLHRILFFWVTGEFVNILVK